MPDLVAFTGHRHIPEDIATEKIDEVLLRLKPDTAIVGGAAGADTLAAERCLELHVPYLMALPHRQYVHQYKLEESARWRRTFRGAHEFVYVVEDKPWHFSHNFKRNEWMVDHSEILVVVSKFNPFAKVPSNGGTAHCVRYARKVKRAMEWVDISPPCRSSQAQTFF